MMKRYAGFAFGTYYPLGGFEDFVGSFDTIEAAKAAVEDWHKKDDTFAPEGHVADTVENKIVFYVDSKRGWYAADAALGQSTQGK